MALTAQRRVSNLIDGLILPFSHPCKAGKVFYKGAAVGLDATGYLVPMTAAATLRCVGVVDTGHAASVDTTGQADGDTELKCQAAIWSFNNSPAGADLLAQVDMWKKVYFVDDQTVGKTDGTGSRSVAGLACRLEGGQVYVAIGFPYVGL